MTQSAETAPQSSSPESTAGIDEEKKNLMKTIEHLEYELAEEERQRIFERKQMMARLGAAERHTALIGQDYPMIQNLYGEFDNRVKGVMKSGPRVFDIATDIFDYVLSRVKILDQCEPFFHPKRAWPPFWQIFLGMMGVIVILALVWPGSTFGADVGKALLIPANQYVLLAALGMVMVIVLVIAMRSKSNKPR